jgi:hypothetical protein
MKEKQLKQKFYLKVYKKGKLVSSFDTGSSRRFFHRCKAVKFLDSMIKAYIKVTYPYKLPSGFKNNKNEIKYIQAYNDGTYDNHKDLLFALNAFLEKL